MIHRSAIHRPGGSALASTPMPAGLSALLPLITNDRGGCGELRLDGDAMGRKRAKRRGNNRAATSTATVPQSAASIGQGERFRYWPGASGRRYLFSRVEIEELSTFDEAVVILETADGEKVSRLSMVELTTNGRLIDRTGAVARERACAAYVHLLARDATARAAVMADISAVL
jgi:hypothetical protein